MNHPSYLGKSIRYGHCVGIFNMRTKYDHKTPHVEWIGTSSRVSTNPLDYRGTEYIVRPLTGNQETKDLCNKW